MEILIDSLFINRLVDKKLLSQPTERQIFVHKKGNILRKSVTTKIIFSFMDSVI